MLGRRDEIGEAVPLVEQLVRRRTSPAHLLAAPHVRDRHDESPVQQAQVFEENDGSKLTPYAP